MITSEFQKIIKLTMQMSEQGKIRAVKMMAKEMNIALGSKCKIKTALGSVYPATLTEEGMVPDVSGVKENPLIILLKIYFQGYQIIELKQPQKKPREMLILILG